MSLYSYASTLTWVSSSAADPCSDAWQAYATTTPTTTSATAASGSALSPVASAWAQDYEMWWGAPCNGTGHIAASAPTEEGGSLPSTAPSSSSCSSLAQLNVTQIGILYECVTSPDPAALDNRSSLAHIDPPVDHKQHLREIFATDPSSPIRLLTDNVQAEENATGSSLSSQLRGAPLHLPELGDSATMVGDSHGSASLTAPTTEPAARAIQWRVGGRPAPLPRDAHVPAALPFSPLRSAVVDSMRTYYFPSGLGEAEELRTPSTHGLLSAQSTAEDAAAAVVDADEEEEVAADTLSGTRRPNSTAAEARPSTSPLARPRPPSGDRASAARAAAAAAAVMAVPVAPEEHLEALPRPHGRHSCPPLHLHAEDEVPTVVASDRALRYMRLTAIFGHSPANKKTTATAAGAGERATSNAKTRRGVSAMPVSVSALRASVLVAAPRVYRSLSRPSTEDRSDAEDGSLFAAFSCLDGAADSLSSTRTVHALRQCADSRAGAAAAASSTRLSSFSSVRTLVVPNPTGEAPVSQPARRAAALSASLQRCAEIFTVPKSPRRASAPANASAVPPRASQRGDVVKALAAGHVAMPRSYAWERAVPPSPNASAAKARGTPCIYVHPRAPPPPPSQSLTSSSPLTSPRAAAGHEHFRRYPSLITPVTLPPPPRRMSGRTAPVMTDTAPLPGKRLMQKAKASPSPHGPTPLNTVSPGVGVSAAVTAAPKEKKTSPHLTPATGCIAPPPTPVGVVGAPVQRASLDDMIPLVRSRPRATCQLKASQEKSAAVMPPALPPITSLKLALLPSDDASQLQTPRDDSSNAPSQASPEWRHVPVPVLRRSLIARVALECARVEMAGSSVLTLHPRHC